LESALRAREVRMRSTLFGSMVLTAVLLVPRPGHALDARRDRSGVYFGIGVGGGTGTSPHDFSLQKDRGGVGMVLHARAGGGLSQKLTFDASLTHFTQTETGGPIEEANQHTLFAVAANAYLTDSLFLRGGVGISQGELSDSFTALGAKVTNSASAMALGVIAGGGIEFFLGSDMAASFTLQGQFHTAATVRFSGVLGYAGITWY
jgi:hypothetical protein